MKTLKIEANEIFSNRRGVFPSGNRKELLYTASSVISTVFEKDKDEEIIRVGFNDGAKAILHMPHEDYRDACADDDCLELTGQYMQGNTNVFGLYPKKG